MTDFGLTLGVQDETSIVLVVNVSFRVASEVKKENAVICFGGSRLEPISRHLERVISTLSVEISLSGEKYSSHFQIGLL